MGAAEWITTILSYLGDFSVYIFVLELLFCVQFPRRKHFVWRLVGCLIPYLILPHISPDFYVWKYFDIGWYNCSFLLVWALSILIIFFCFRISLFRALFFGSTAFIIQNFCFSVEWIMRITFFADDMNGLGYNIVHFTVSAISVLLYWLLLVRRQRENNELTFSAPLLTLFSVVTVVAINIFVRWMWMENGGTLRIIDAVYSMLCCVLLLALQYGIYFGSKVSHDKEVTEQILAQSGRQSVLAKEQIEMINIKCHDLKHQISALRQKGTEGEKEEVLKELEENVLIYDSIARSGNETLDTVLTEKSLLCEKHHITFTYMADGKALGFMSNADIYSLFGNAFDNAIESVRREVDETLRIIQMNMHTQGKFLYILIENYCGQPLQFINGLPQTTKSDHNYHGFGTKSIRYIVKKYGGQCTMRQIDRRFELSIVFPL